MLVDHLCGTVPGSAPRRVPGHGGEPEADWFAHAATAPAAGARPGALWAATWQRVEQVCRPARDQVGRISPQMEQARVTEDAITGPL